MTVPVNFKKALALVVLNASRDATLREERAKALNEAGYFTVSVRTPEEAVTLASQVKCVVAVVCPSFTDAERRFIGLRIHQVVPATTLILLRNSSVNDLQVLISAVHTALAS